MKYLLDTNICIFLIKNKPESVAAHFKKLVLGDVGISSITLAELHCGVEKSQQKEKNRQALDYFLLPLEICFFDDQAAHDYGITQAELEKKGTPIGPLNLLIAAHAKSLKLTLVTNNTKEFSRVHGLKLVDWVG